MHWARVEEAHRQSREVQSAMGPVSSALVAVMVGALAAPAATAAGVAASTAVGSGVAGTVAAGAVEAGVLALATQAGVSLANNDGDLGKVLDELGSKQSVRNLAVAVVTGGVLAGMSLPATGLSPVAAGSQDVFDLLLNNLKAQTATALIQSAINGTDLEDSLQQALVNALVNTVGAKVANGIGDNFNGALNKVAHLMAGCALGAARSGDAGGCAPGAIGAVVGELMAEATGASPQMQSYLGTKDNQVYMASLFAGLAGALAGGDQKDIATASWAGSNAAANNRLAHQEEYDFAKRNMKLVAKKLGITEQEAEGRIVAEILRNSDAVYASGTGGDYEIRSLLGCQNLNCDGVNSDPNFADHNYNNQFVAANQEAYDAALGELPTGKTHEELIASNVKNDPIGTTIAGAGIVGFGYITGGAGATLGAKVVGAGVGALLNQQIQPDGQPTDWIDVGLAGATGFLTTGMGLGSSVLTNVGGSLFGSGLKGENPNVGMQAAGFGTVVGYGAGKSIEIPANNLLNPWWRPTWREIGLGMSIPNSPSAIPGMAGNTGSSLFQEATSKATKGTLERMQKE